MPRLGDPLRLAEIAAALRTVQAKYGPRATDL
jgi:hypothetical protein